MAAAELEGGDDPGLVTVETPSVPTNDVEALLLQVLSSNFIALSFVDTALIHLTLTLLSLNLLWCQRNSIKSPCVASLYVKYVLLY